MIPRVDDMNILQEPVRLFGVFEELNYKNSCENSSMYPTKVTQPAIIETIQTKPFPIRGE